MNFELEYCYGYRCFDTRQNIFYTSNNNQIVYMAAAIGIVLNTQSNTQTFFGAGRTDTVRGHADDITALSISKNRNLVCTGEVGANPKVCIWDPSNPSSVRAEFKIGRGRRGVTACGFSSDDRYVAVSDIHNDHYVGVYDTSSGSKVGEEKGGTDKILDLCWSQTEPIFVTAGIKHIYFWSLQGGLSKEKGIYGGKGPMVNMTSAAFHPDGSALTGGTNGLLYLWKGRNLERTIPVIPGNGAIHTLRVSGDKILVGGRDNKVHVLDLNFAEKNVIDVGSCPRAVDINSAGTIVVGSRDGTIAEFSPQRTVRMESHSDGEVWGLAINPQDPTRIISVGDDNKIKAWDTRGRCALQTGVLESEKGPERRAGYGASTLASTSPNQQGRAVAVNPANGNVVVCHNDGHVTVRRGTDIGTVIGRVNEPKEWSECVRFSPDGTKLAIGSHDNRVYIYNLSDNSLVATCQGHSSFITGLDWSVDSQALHTVDGAYELLFWDGNTGEQIKDGATKFCDEEWATWSTILGWPVRGIFKGIIDYTHINRVDRASSGDMVATGNDWGLVEIFGFPNEEGAQSVALRAHSEHVTNVKWGPGDAVLFSAGGYDQTIMQWARRG